MSPQPVTPRRQPAPAGAWCCMPPAGGNYNEPQVAEDLRRAVFPRQNGIPVTIAEKEQCCGMPKLELGDLEAVARAKEANIPVLAKLVDEGWDIVAPVPSCALMFKQELPLMFPDDPDVQKVKKSTFRPLRVPDAAPQRRQAEHRFQAAARQGRPTTCPATCVCRTSASRRVSCCNSCRIPGSRPSSAARGHDGTYAVKSEFHAASMKICRPVVDRASRRARAIITAATARWPGTRSRMA